MISESVVDKFDDPKSSLSNDFFDWINGIIFCDRSTSSGLSLYEKKMSYL